MEFSSPGIKKFPYTFQTNFSRFSTTASKFFLEKVSYIFSLKKTDLEKFLMLHRIST